MMSEKNITILVPLGSWNDIHRFKSICLPTITRFADKTTHKLLIVSPIKFDIECSHRLTIIHDSKIYNGTDNGWPRQQVLKLLAHKYIDTEWYVILDADCYYTRECTLKDYFLPNSNIARVNIGDHHRKWWLRSSKALQLPPPRVRCGVTPMVMNTELVKCLCESVPDISMFIVKNGCTEYTLYWTYISEKVNMDAYYDCDKNTNLTDHDTWGRRVSPIYKSRYQKQDGRSGAPNPTDITYNQYLELIAERIANAFNDDTNFLSLTQSNLIKWYPKITDKQFIKDVGNIISSNLEGKL